MDDRSLLKAHGSWLFLMLPSLPMSLHLYNTLSKRDEEFTPAHSDEVLVYTCGPTVYGRPHIANYSSFLMADLVCRWLEAGHGMTVKHVKNITDVGHLVADADDGEDKIEKQAKAEHGTVTSESVLAIAKTYEEQYLEDERALNMREPQERPRASEYVDAMKEMITKMLADGFAYATSDGIYFDLTKNLPTPYGTLSGNLLDQLVAGSRVAVNSEKHTPADFALWKFCVGANEHHVLRWPSPQGPTGETFPDGFPGWHIECSAMARSLLGDQIDLHTGGEDNIFPHHECEIAQTECITGVSPFSRHWLHRRRIDIGGEKMSKSLGNMITLPDIIERGFSPLDLRYYFLSVHYRTNLKFDWDGLKSARTARLALSEWIGRNGYPEFATGHNAPTADARIIADYRKKFTDSMDDDLNVSGALAAVFECIHYMNKSAAPREQVEGELNEFIALLTATFACFEQEAVPEEVKALADKRQEARMQKDFSLSDNLRDEILQKGYEVLDRGDLYELRKI